jgi:hypothetical protein
MSSIINCILLVAMLSLSSFWRTLVASLYSIRGLCRCSTVCGLDAEEMDSSESRLLYVAEN